MIRPALLILSALLVGCASTTEPEIELTEQELAVKNSIDASVLPDEELMPYLAQMHRVHGDVALMKQDFATAEEEYQRSLTLVPGYPDSLVGLSQLRLQQKRVEESRRLLEELLRRHPDNLLGWHNLASLRLRVDKDIPGALQAVERMLAIDPGNAKAANFKKNLEALLAERRDAAQP